MAGEAANSVNGFSSEEEKVEDALCIVKFRPCEDWSGEYGFDWVREGKDDFEEKIGVAKSIASYGNDKDHNYAGYIPDDIAVDMLRKQKGDEEYEKWREEKRKNLTQNSDKFYVDEKGKVVSDDEELNKTLEFLVDGLASIAIREDVRLYDETAWQTDGRIRVENNISRVDDGVQPMEYVYSPKHVISVKYYLNSKDLAGIWRSEVNYKDIANGYHEAEEAAYKLDYFMDTPSTMLSLLKKGDGYVLPYYLEKENDTISINNDEEINVWEWVSGKGVFCKSITGLEIFTEALRYTLDDRYGLYYKDGKDFDKISYKKIEYIQKEIKIELAYWHINGKTYLLAKWTKMFIGKTYQLFYEDGNVISTCQSGWKRWLDLESEEKSEIKNTISPFFTEDIVLDRVFEDLPTMLNKVKNKEIDDVIITIGNPHSLKEYNLPANELTKDSLGREFWNGNRIVSWQEHYEDSFTHFNMRLKKEKRKEKKDVIKYCVPELSISHEDIKRTHFKFNTSIDAPIKSTEPKNEYKLLLRYEGNCDELRFETDQPDSIIVEPSVIENPKDKDSITVKYKGSYVPLAIINAIGVKKYLVKDTEKLAGQLKVRINPSKLIKIMAIKVAIGGQGLSQKFEDCIEDQFDSMNNVFSQVGIKTDVMNLHVNLDEAMFNGFLVDGKIDTDKTVSHEKKGIKIDLGDAVLTALEEKFKFGERIALVLMQSVIFIYIDKSIHHATAYQTYSDIYHCKYEVFGQDISFTRARLGVFAHESLHALNCSHVFQMGGFLRKNPFCFPLRETSNIMDYSMVLYSLHKYQWDIMNEEYPNFQSQIWNNTRKYAMNDEKIRRELFIEKKRKQKRDRLFSNKLNEISKGSTINKRK